MDGVIPISFLYLFSEDEAVESETKEATAVEDYRPAAPSVQQNSVSFKFEVNLDEVEVNVTTAVKPLADIHIKGMFIRKDF